LLVALILNLNMTGGGGTLSPQNPFPSETDGGRPFENIRNYEVERRKKILAEDDSMMPLIVEKILRECL